MQLLLLLHTFPPVYSYNSTGYAISSTHRRLWFHHRKIRKLHSYSSSITSSHTTSQTSPCGGTYYFTKVCIFTSRRWLKIQHNSAKYPAILPSHTSNNWFIIYYSALAADSYSACTVQRSLLRNELQGAGLFLALDSTSMHTDPSTSERKYCKLENNAILYCVLYYKT